MCFHICLLPLAAQDQDVFAPFVSRLAVTVEGRQALVSWKNSEDMAGPKLIYRAETEITEATFSRAVLVSRVGPEAESFIDTPPPGTVFFYAVIVEDAKGESYRVFIPFRNKTIAGIRIEPPRTGEDDPAVVSGLSAVAAADGVSLRFAVSNKRRALVLYRGTAPLTTPADLERAAYSVLLAPGTDRKTDAPPAGIDYYYAVVDADLVTAGQVVLTPGGNTTAAPVQIPLDRPVAGADTARARTFPLPAPHILYSVETGDELLPPLPFLLPPLRKLSDRAGERVDKNIERLRRPETNPPFTLLVHEQAPNLTGEDLALQAIAVAAAAAGDQKETVEKLAAFLGGHHSANAQARARFYLGQAHFLRGAYREALVEFVLARSVFYVETQAWIDLCLERLSAAPSKK